MQDLAEPLQTPFIVIQWLIGLMSLAVTIGQPDFRYQANNILEWNFALAMTGFYAMSGLIWKKFWVTGDADQAP